MNPIQNRSDQNHTQFTGKLQSHPEAWTELHTITRAATTRAATVRAATGQRTWRSNATKMMTALAVLMVARITAVVALLPVAVFELASLLIRKSPLEPWLVALSWLTSLVIVALWLARGRSR